jgi:uncharacterized membrane protein YfcA
MTGLAGLIPLVLIGLLVGVLIGCIGIGGVLLVPSLTYIGDMQVHVAIASCMFSYLFSGAVGAVEFARRGSIRWSMSGWLCAGAMPGAFLGAANVSVVPGIYLEFFIAALILFSGAHALLRRAETAEGPVPSGAQLALIGAVTGYGSAMSGTGGPLLLVPILVWLKLPVLTAVGLGQVIQLPVAALATWGNLMYGTVDIAVGLSVAVLLMTGVTIGARIAHRVPSYVLRRTVALVLLAVGALIVTRLSVGF